MTDPQAAADAPPAGLARRLRDTTHTRHRAAESAPFMAALLRGEIDRAAYADYLSNLHAIYDALESALAAHRSEPAFAPFDFPALRRAPVLGADLHALGFAPAALRPATQRYVERLQRAAQAQPWRLLGHAYVRYLGDLHGGQLMRRIVAGALQLDAQATTFYDFGDEARVRELIAQFRAALDALPLDPAQRDDLVDEACWAFDQHRLLFDELAYALPKPRMRP